MGVLYGTVVSPDDVRPSLERLVKYVVEPDLQQKAPRKCRRITERQKDLIYYEAHSGRYTLHEISMRNQVNRNSVVTIRDTWTPKRKRSPR